MNIIKDKSNNEYLLKNFTIENLFSCSNTANAVEIKREIWKIKSNGGFALVKAKRLEKMPKNKKSLGSL
ncbi:MAG: hypothetical protein HZB36_05645 [Candidatus Omnitrophica bacterium]|nr:hypothetical protein [Candidatus Omnitrophota bacterium]